jgi:CubicO group peptidase (beta-lactamase class C family)
MTAEPQPDRFFGVRGLVHAGIAEQAFPAAVIEVGRRDGVVWREAFGRLTYSAESPPCVADTVFDLASLTKVIVTASLAMRHVAESRIGLDDRVTAWSADWRGDDRAHVTIRQLLDHSSGLPAHLRLFQYAHGRESFEAEIGRTPLDREPGSSAVYSDLGYLLIGFILERLGAASLARQFSPLAEAIGAELLFRPPAELRGRIAPTEFDAWRGRVLIGEVHDENAAAIGGIAGHAGLFGTAAGVGAFARLVLETFRQETRLGSPRLMREFATRSPVPGSSRALGWDTMKPTSSCGRLLSPAAIGHTGFTGTSLWIDPEQDLYVVILTNRVHPSREPNRLAPMRRTLHEAIVEAVGAPSGPGP